MWLNFLMAQGSKTCVTHRGISSAFLSFLSNDFSNDYCRSKLLICDGEMCGQAAQTNLVLFSSVSKIFFNSLIYAFILISWTFWITKYCIHSVSASLFIIIIPISVLYPFISCCLGWFLKFLLIMIIIIVIINIICKAPWTYSQGWDTAL